MNDFSQRQAAGWLTDEAKRIITTERANAHGSAEDSFTMIGQFWTTYVTNANYMRHGNDAAIIFIDAQDVAEMMSLLKKARKVHGNQTNMDNAIDDIGYTALGGGMQMDSAKPEAVGEATACDPSSVDYAHEGDLKGWKEGRGEAYPTDTAGVPKYADGEYTISPDNPHGYMRATLLTEAEYKELMDQRSKIRHNNLAQGAGVGPGNFATILGGTTRGR